MLGVGFDRWPSVLRQIADRADASRHAVPAAPQAPVAQVPPQGGQNADRTMSAAGQAALAAREGQAAGNGYYNDSANNCTYGVGLLAHPGPCSGAELRRTVDARQAQAEFQKRMNDAAQRVREYVPDRRLTQNQFDALVSVTYNTTRQDSDLILDAANQGNDVAVGNHLRNTVYTHRHDAKGHPVGPAVRSQGLINRRNDGIQQYGRP